MDPKIQALTALEPRALEPTADGARERSNWDALSLLRFGLALIVAAGHLQKVSPGLGSLGRIADTASFEAVLGFLLISGFSIGHSIQKKPQGFFGRRLWRIYPVYFAAVVLTFAARPQPLTGSLLGDIFLNLLFLNQVFVSSSYVVPAWTLSLEIWLYALAPVLVRWRGASLQFLAGASFACYALYTCGRSLFHWPGFTGTLGALNLPCLAFIWIAGFYMSVSRLKARPLKIAGALFAAHLALTMFIQALYRCRHHDLPGFWTSDLIDYLWHGGPLVISLLVFIGIAAHRLHLPAWQHPLARFLGDISYPLYLVHLCAFAWAARFTANPVLLLLAALVLATVVYLGCDFYSRRRR